MGTTSLTAEFCINNDGPKTAVLKLVNSGNQIYYNASFPWNGQTGSLSGQTLAGVATNVTISLVANGNAIDVNVSGDALGYGAGTLTGSVTISSSGVTCTPD